MQQAGQHSTPKYVMRHFTLTSDKRYETFKKILMYPGLALIVGVSKFLEGFPRVTLDFGLHVTFFGVLLTGRPLMIFTICKKDTCS